MYLVYGTVGIFFITILVAYAYLKKPIYGISLGITSVILILSATFWNLSENSREEKKLEKIPPQELSLSNENLIPAYGNHYLYTALLKNNAVKSQLISIQLQLSIFDKPIEKIGKWSKTWLAAGKSENLSIYFTSSKMAKAVDKGKWKVKVVATKAR